MTLRRFQIILMLIMFLCIGTNAQEKPKAFRDSIDNAFDVSHYLYNLRGFLPIISPITEPAVGYGATLAGAIFIPKKDSDPKKFTMPDVIVAAGGYTENKTWFVGGGYLGFWKDDHIRYRGFMGYADVKLKYYWTSKLLNKDLSADFRLKTYFLLQQAIFRIRDSKFLFGGSYLLMKTNIIFFEDIEIPGIKPRDKDLVNSGLSAIGEFDNLDNLFSPSRGHKINLTYTQYLKAIGSDRDFGRLTLYMLYYQPVYGKKWISGFRIESNLSTGDPPFYMKPFIQLRGIPAMRYQGEFTALIETEQEVALYRRWSIVGYGGIGWASRNIDDFDDGQSAWNVGTGFRYLIARVFGLKMGLDVAKGPEDWAVYVVFGSSWNR